MPYQSPSDKNHLEEIFDKAVRETVNLFEKTGSPVISDGEQSKASFVTYPLHGLSNLTDKGMKIDFADGHFRQLPLLKNGPFRYQNYAEQYLRRAQKYARLPLKQAVISASALSLIYPPDGIKDYSQRGISERPYQ